MGYAPVGTRQLKSIAFRFDKYRSETISILSFFEALPSGKSDKKMGREGKSVKKFDTLV